MAMSKIKAKPVKSGGGKDITTAKAKETSGAQESGTKKKRMAAVSTIKKAK